MTVSRALAVVRRCAVVTAALCCLSPVHAQQVAETVYQQNFDRQPLGPPAPDARDDSGWAGGKVPLSTVRAGRSTGRALEAKVNGFCQLWLGDFNLKAGEPYRVSVDVASRGVQTLTLSVRQTPEPYTNHGGQEFQTNESPRTLGFVFRAQPNGNPARIQIVLRGSTQLTIDNLRVERLTGLPPASATGDPLSQLLPGKPITPGNLLLNSSFELEHDGWFRRGPSEFPVTSGAPHGKRAAKLKAGGNLFSSWLALSLRNEYQVSAQVKSLSDQTTVRLELGDYVNFRGGQAGKSVDFTVQQGEGWKPIRFTYRPPVPPNGIAPTREFYVGIGCGGGKDTQVLVDSVEVRAVGGDAQGGRIANPNTPYAPAAPVEMAVFPRSPFGVAVEGETVMARVLAASASPVKRGTLVLQDEDGRTVRQVPVRFAKGAVEAQVTLPKLPPGYWRLVMLPSLGDGSGYIAGEAFVSVVPRLPSVPPDRWHFGTHVRARPDIQAACRTLGWRLNRLHDVSSVTKWPTVQPLSGSQWSWGDDEAAQLGQGGMRLLGNLDQVPSWAPQNGEAGQGGTERATDQTFALWQEYCRRTSEHFRGRIDEWEVTNEPNLSGMTPEHYVRVLQAASDGVRAGNPNARIVGLGGATPPVTEWVAKVIALGGGRLCDAVSVHNYGGTTWGSEAGPDALTSVVRFVHRELKGAGAATLPVWDTESGLITQSSFRKFRQPFGDTVPRDGARMMPKAVATVLASGLSRWYFYAAFDATAPGEIAGFTAGDINDTLKMPFQPMAVAIALLEGRAYQGQDARAKAAGRVDLLFADARETTRIVWMQPGRPAQSLSVASNVRVLSHWGRAVPVAGGRVRVGQEPLYLVTTLGRPRQTSD